jgi:hypothetical protein
MPIDLAQVDWLYVVVLAVFVALATFVGNLLSFNRRGAAAILSAVLFSALFIFWTYYPHRVPFLPRTLSGPQAATETKASQPAAPAAPAAPQKPRNPVTDITPPRNPVTDVTPSAPSNPPDSSNTPAPSPAAPAR